MLKNMRWILIVALVGVFSFFGCSTAEGVGDSITIISVTPSSGLLPGVATTFVINVEYNLVSVDNGEINLGFNTDVVGTYKIVKEILVTKGSGQYQFNVTIVTKNWGSSGNFGVYVNLSEYPHGTTWTPLATDIWVLTF